MYTRVEWVKKLNKNIKKSNGIDVPFDLIVITAKAYNYEIKKLLDIMLPLGQQKSSMLIAVISDLLCGSSINRYQHAWKKAVLAAAWNKRQRPYMTQATIIYGR